MKIAEIPFAVVRFQYQIARLPLQLIEDRVASRLGSEVPARLFYERSLGALDATVGNLLGDRELAKRGAALVERSNTLSKAAQLDATATRNREQADAKLEASRDDVLTDLKQARDATEQQAVEARANADQRKRVADEEARKRTAAAKKQAEDAAAQRQKTAETAKRQEEAKIRATEQMATNAAKSKLDDAQVKRGEAASKRAQADRIEETAGIEKQKRRSGRVNQADS